MAVNDLYMATLHQTYGAGGKACDTVWSYRAVDPFCTAEGLAENITEGDGILKLANDMQSSVIKNVSIRVVNLFSLVDFADIPLTGAGLGSADSAARFNALKYTLKLNTRGINPGRKSFRGVPDGVQEAGVITNATFLAQAELLRIEMGRTLGIALAGQYEPVVIGRIKMSPDADHPEEWYRLPASEGEANWGKVTAVLFNPRVGHQVSGE